MLVYYLCVELLIALSDRDLICVLWYRCCIIVVVSVLAFFREVSKQVCEYSVVNCVVIYWVQVKIWQVLFNILEVWCHVFCLVGNICQFCMCGYCVCWCFLGNIALDSESNISFFLGINFQIKAGYSQRYKILTRIFNECSVKVSPPYFSRKRQMVCSS